MPFSRNSSDTRDSKASLPCSRADRSSPVVTQLPCLQSTPMPSKKEAISCEVSDSSTRSPDGEGLTWGTRSLDRVEYST